MLIQAFYAQQFSVHLVIWRKISPWTMPLKTVYGTFHFTMCKFQLDAAQVENELRIISLWNGILMEKWKFFMMTSLPKIDQQHTKSQLKWDIMKRFDLPAMCNDWTQWQTQHKRNDSNFAFRFVLNQAQIIEKLKQQYRLAYVLQTINLVLGFRLNISMWICRVVVWMHESHYSGKQKSEMNEWFIWNNSFACLNVQ